tara:strand:+ start:225 stop:560 length:336 start_codon:yes stop_codon:yes gene_type:complete
MENLKSTKTGTKETNLKELLLPSIKYLDPRREPNKWLGAVLIDLLEQDTKESKEALKWAFPRMAQWLEPGIIDQLFVPWIDQYMELLAEDENTQNTENPQSLLKDHQELKE